MAHTRMYNETPELGLLICGSDHSADGLVLAMCALFNTHHDWFYSLASVSADWWQWKWKACRRSAKISILHPWKMECQMPQYPSNLPGLPGVNCFLACFPRVNLYISYPVHLKIQNFSSFHTMEVNTFSFSSWGFLKDNSINLQAAGLTILTFHLTTFCISFLAWLLRVRSGNYYEWFIHFLNEIKPSVCSRAVHMYVFRTNF